MKMLWSCFMKCLRALIGSPVKCLIAVFLYTHSWLKLQVIIYKYALFVIFKIAEFVFVKQVYLSYDYGTTFTHISDKFQLSADREGKKQVISQFYHSPADNKHVSMEEKLALLYV